MKIGSQKTEFQGEFGAGHEKKSKRNQQIEKIYKITRTGPIPGPDIRTGIPRVAGSAEGAKHHVYSKSLNNRGGRKVRRAFGCPRVVITSGGS